MDKKSIVNNFYRAALISGFAIAYSMLGKSMLKILEDSLKLVVIVAASEMTREYLIKNKFIPENINV